MKTKNWLIVASAAIAVGVGGSILFHELAVQTREKRVEEEARLEALQQQIDMRQAAYSRDSLNRVFVTADLAFFGLHGKVREMRQGELLASFTEEGVWTNPGIYVTRAGYSPQFERNKFNYIIGGTSRETIDGAPMETLVYTWKDGRLVKIESTGPDGDYTIKFTYGPKNLLASSHTICHDEGGESEISTSYTYKKIDRLGNWTEREARSAIKNVQYGGYYDDENDTYIEGDEPIIESNSEIETRIISYY